MPKRKTKTRGAAAEERESEAIDREMDEAAGPLDDAAEDEGSDGEEAKAAPETTSEEERLAQRVLTTLRASEKPLTVEELHPEQNAEGQEGYVAAGQVEKALGVLLARGLAEREGEAWQPVRPGVLARRRAELLKDFEIADGQPDREDQEGQIADLMNDLAKDPTKNADALALLAAGLLVTVEDTDVDGEPFTAYSVTSERADEMVLRGALALVEETMAECREAHAAVITDGDPAAELAKERTSRQGFEAMYEGAVKQRDAAQQTAARARADVETCREWFKKNNLPCPLDKPEVPKPPRDEFTHTVHVDPVARGKMYGIRVKLQRQQGDIDGALATAKATHKAHSELVAAKLKSLDESVEGMWYEAAAFRRTDVHRGVIEVVSVDDETWILQTIPLRSEEAGGEPAPAEPAPSTPEVAPAETPADPNALRVVPADEHGQAAEAALPSGASAAPAPVVTPTPVPEPEPAKPSRDLVLKIGPVGDALVALVATLGPDEGINTLEATNRLAKEYGITEAVASLGQLVRAAARKLHAAGKIRHEVTEGAEIIGRVREKKPEANGASNGAPKPAEPVDPDPTAAVLAKIRAAGADGLRRIEFADDQQPAIDTLLERGAVKKNGKKGLGARIVAAEHAPTNGAAAEASA